MSNRINSLKHNNICNNKNKRTYYWNWIYTICRKKQRFHVIHERELKNERHAVMFIVLSLFCFVLFDYKPSGKIKPYYTS